MEQNKEQAVGGAVDDVLGILSSSGWKPLVFKNFEPRLSTVVQKTWRGWEVRRTGGSS